MTFTIGIQKPTTRRLKIGKCNLILWPHFIYTFTEWVCVCFVGWAGWPYPTNCVRSGNLNPWKVKLADGLERGTRGGGGRKSTISLELVLWSTRPHWALHTSSRRITSRGHSRANWAQSVIRREAHCGWKN